MERGREEAADEEDEEDEETERRRGSNEKQEPHTEMWRTKTTSSRACITTQFR